MTAEPLTFDAYLRGAIVDRATIDLFLDPERPSWAEFDSITGYKLRNFLPRDGVDGSATISTYDGWTRTARMYTDKRPRIATYGNSFTQCHQVSDGETWQEYLAAHLGEPIRNLGVGGFGVYHAYRRLIAEEQTERGAEHLVLYVWGDDHIRSLTRCRQAAIYPVFDTSGTTFHANFWANVEMNLDTGELEERENLLATPASLYRMTDADWMGEALRDDLALRLWAYHNGWVGDLDMTAARRLADCLGVSGAALTETRPAREAIRDLLDRYSLAATEQLLARARSFAEAHGKQLLVVLFDPFRALGQMVTGASRYDQQIVDFLREREFRHFDMNEAHVADYGCFSISWEAYMERYFIDGVGHYNPSGNHFFAHALKPLIVDWLDPKPITYADSDERGVDYRGYLRA